MSNGDVESQSRIVALRELIQRAFPAEVYKGKVMSVDGKWTPELDEEKELFDALHARRWTDLPEQLLTSQPDGYCLLTDGAFAAFFAAWMMVSLENIEAENEVRNFVAYAFHNTLRKFETLNTDQQKVVRSLLEEFAHHERSPYIRRCAAESVALIDKFWRKNA